MVNRLRISAGIYADHQATIDYPIAYITRNASFFESIYLFGSDQENTALLEHIRDRHPLRDKIKCVNIGAKIVVPGDIAAAQNRCVDYWLEHDRSEYFAVIQADILLTERAYTFIDAWMTPDNLRSSVHLTVKHIRLFTEAHQTYFGVTIMGRESKKRFIGDGAYVEGWPYWAHEWNCLDIGYFSTAAYFRHVLRHSQTWSDNKTFAHLVELYPKDKKAFIRTALRYAASSESPGSPLVLIDPKLPLYRDFLDHFALGEDYENVREVFNELHSG